MSDEENNLEVRLRRQPLRAMPSEWRDEILSAAREQGGFARPRSHSFLSFLRRQLTNLLWPHPTAWAGLAAAWVIIVSLLSYSPDDGKQVAQGVPPSSELIAVVKQQRRELAKLVEPSLSADAEPAKPSSPGPRSQFAGRFQSV